MCFCSKVHSRFMYIRKLLLLFQMLVKPVFVLVWFVLSFKGFLGMTFWSKLGLRLRRYAH